MAMLRLEFNAFGQPSPRKIEHAREIVHKGGIAAYPTDSVFALGCAIDSKQAVERIYQAKQMPANQRLALICPDLSTASEYGVFNHTAFRLAQRIFPGAYTLVVPATAQVPRTLLDKKRRTVGIRITTHPVAQALVQALGRPLLTTTAIHADDEEACNDADSIIERFGHCLDVLLDAEPTGHDSSTILQVEGDEIIVVREGAGSLDGLIL